MTKPRLLVFDIETSLSLVTTHSLKVPSKYLPYYSIKKERNILCATAKWLGESKLYSFQVPDDFSNDFYILQDLRKLFEEADAVIAHYGDGFDIPFMNGRIAYHGIDPFPKIIQIDTKKLAQKNMLLSSYKLDYLGQFFKVGKKIHTDHTLWDRCLQGDKKALEQMVRYNQQDVKLLEKVYNKLKPYVPAQVNRQLFGSKDSCTHCGSNKLQHRGFYYTKKQKYQRYLCLSCGAWSRANKAEKL